jgi:hypothetical protein
MTFQDYSMNNAYQLGAYKAIAEMMAEAVRKLDETEAGSLEAEFAMMSLVSLAKQFEETKEKFEKEVDNAVA